MHENPWVIPILYRRCFNVVCPLGRLMFNKLCHSVRKRTFAMCAREDSDQPAHSRSPIRIFTWRILDREGCKVSSCGHNVHQNLSDCRLYNYHNVVFYNYKCSRLSLSRCSRDCLQYFEIFVPRHIRFAELRGKNQTNTFHK